MPDFLKRATIGLALALGLGPLLSAASPPPPPTITDQALLTHLNEAIRWHREVQASRIWIDQPSDEFFWNTQQNLANQVVQTAFAASRAELPLVVSAPPKKTPATVASDAEQQRLAKLLAARAERIRGLQAQVDALDRQMAAAAPEARDALSIRRNALEAELELFKTMGESLQKITEMLSGPGDDGGTTLSSRIDGLQLTVPEAFPDAAGAAAPPPQPNPAIVLTGGLIKRTTTLLALGRSLHGIDELTKATALLQASVAALQAPLRATVGNIARQGEKLGDQLATDKPGQWVGTRESLEALSTQFKEVSVISLPLRKETQLFKQSVINLGQWRESVHDLYHRTMISLFTRIGTILAMLATVFGISEVWERMTLRYVQDERRIRQFMLVRRFVTGALMIAVIIIGFMSDFSSLATVAGVITAGIAVALQTILLSIVAYFFMIGRSGLRAGDRVTIAGVTGDVLHVGPVRFQLRELSAVGKDFVPTGRVAIFSNAVIFQHNPVFRPMPEEKKP